MTGKGAYSMGMRYPLIMNSFIKEAVIIYPKTPLSRGGTERRIGMTDERSICIAVIKFSCERRDICR